MCWQGILSPKFLFARKNGIFKLELCQVLAPWIDDDEALASAMIYRFPSKKYQFHAPSPLWTRTTGREHQDNYLKIIKVMVMVKIQYFILHLLLLTSPLLRTSTTEIVYTWFLFYWNTHTHKLAAAPQQHNSLTIIIRNCQAPHHCNYTYCKSVINWPGAQRALHWYISPPKKKGHKVSV